MRWWIVRLLVLVVVGCLLVFASTRPSEGANHGERYTVKRYDTLWAIAASHYGGDPRDAIGRIADRNHLHSSTITPGETLLLP